MLQAIDSIELSTNIEFSSSIIEVLHGWVLLIPSEHLLGLLDLVWLVYILYGDDGEVAVITEIPQSKTSTLLQSQLIDLCFRNIEGNGHGEEVAVNKSIVLNNAVER